MEMNVSLTDVSPSQKKIRVEIPGSKVAEELQKKYRELAKKTKIKGFRPGKVPIGIIKSYYGKAVEQEVSSQFIQDTFHEALKETDIKPLTQADVSESQFEEDGAFTYTAVVDICPPFELPEYKGLNLYKPAIEVTDEQVQEEMGRLAESHAQLKALETERPIAEGDMAIVDFTPIVDGRVLEKGKTEDFMVEVGENRLHPDFDKNLIGHKPGDSFSFDLDYPEDAPTPELAGKQVRFDVTVKDLKIKEVPEVNDEFAQSLGSGQFENLEALKTEFRTKLWERQERISTKRLQTEITDKLMQAATFEISPRVIDREAEFLLANIRRQFEAQGLRFDSEPDSEHYKEMSRVQAEKDIRTRLVLEKIAEAEGIALDSEEEEQVFKDAATKYRMDVKKFKSEFGDSVIVEKDREKKLEDKVLKFIESEATFVDTPEEAKGPEEEAAPEAPEGTEQA